MARGPATGRGHELPLAPDGAHPPQAGGSQRGARRSPAHERHDAVGPREETKCTAGGSNGPRGPPIFHVDPPVVCVDPPVVLVSYLSGATQGSIVGPPGVLMDPTVVLMGLPMIPVGQTVVFVGSPMVLMGPPMVLEAAYRSIRHWLLQGV